MPRISDFIILQQFEQPALTIEHTVNVSQLPATIGESFMKIAGYLNELEVTMTDIPFVCFAHAETMTPDNIRMTVGFKTPLTLPSKFEIKSIMIPKQKIVSCLYRGRNDEMGSLYDEIQKWISANDYKSAGGAREYYYTGPDFPDNEQVTRIEIPLL